MFQNLKNLDTAFRHVRSLAFVTILTSLAFASYMGYSAIRAVTESQKKIYILAEGKALEAFASDRRENIPVEARDHVKMFHHYFFTLSPDENQIRDQMVQSLYLADASAKTVYDNLREQGYYSGLVAANISQSIQMDSVQVSTDLVPFQFWYWGKQTIVRPSSVTYRRLYSKGNLRVIERTDRNPHGLLIENWEIVSNETLKTEQR
ncbi:conjugative transposon protein TraK [Algoriphagus terrigena]|uniref:conjugative transposon protein TraK n=1 Tax=Algoriphagus terrigena TaxID=344884 RepID=UPI0004279515|nr:conjugative transposon protein TraK [Algoriphagus terrigena]